MANETSPITVFFDGACPLCVREISLLRKLTGPDDLRFEDVSPPDAAPSCDISRERLLARFHVRLPDGEMVEGAQAFTESWARVGGLGWVAGIGRFAPTRWLLNRCYDLFLQIRPAFQAFARRLTREKQPDTL